MKEQKFSAHGPCESGGSKCHFIASHGPQMEYILLLFRSQCSLITIMISSLTQEYFEGALKIPNAGAVP